MFQKSFGVELFSGNSLNAIHDAEAPVEFFRYLNGTIYPIQSEVVDFLDNKKKTTIPSLSDGYYIAMSNSREKLFAKGNLDRIIFIRYHAEIKPNDISVERLDLDGNFIANGTAIKVLDDLYVMSIPSDVTEILMIDELFVACEPMLGMKTVNVYRSNNGVTMKANDLKTDIISDKLRSRVKDRGLKHSVRKTSFRSE